MRPDPVPSWAELSAAEAERERADDGRVDDKPQLDLLAEQEGT